MLVVHQMVNGHPQYHSTDTRSTFIRKYFAKNIKCATELGLFGPRPMYSVLDPKSVPLLLATHYTTLPDFLSNNSSQV